MQRILHDEALRYFTETIRHSASSINDPFDKLKDRIMTPAHMDTNTS